jgi:hypothetical protein
MSSEPLGSQSRDDVGKLREELTNLRERLVRVEADRKWLVVVGLIFAALLGATNLVTIPAKAKSAAADEVKNQMPGLVQSKVAEYFERNQGRDLLAATRRYATEAEAEQARAANAANETSASRAAAARELERISSLDRETIRDDSGRNLRVVAGSTKAKETRWKQYIQTNGKIDPNAIYVEVDTSAAGFSDTPRYFVSISGGSGLYQTTGLGGVYSPNRGSFSVYLRFAGAITPKKANEYGWTVNWVAFGT